MANDAEERVKRFYRGVGWQTQDGIAEDTRRFEDLRACAGDYVRRCRLRVMRHIPERGAAILDMASGPIVFDEYLEYSKNFEKRHCVDLSEMALEGARARIGDHGVYHCGSFFDLEFDDDFFDCALSLHTIYHMDAGRQEIAVRKLLRVTKPGHPVIVVYTSPRTLLARLLMPWRWFKKTVKRILVGRLEPKEPELYFSPHPIDWWRRFEDIADVQIFPWRSFDTPHQQALFPNNALGRWMFDRLFALEDRFPRFFARNFQWPMIVLRRNGGDSTG